MTAPMMTAHMRARESDLPSGAASRQVGSASETVMMLRSEIAGVEHVLDVLPADAHLRALCALVIDRLDMCTEIAGHAPRSGADST
ncbi:MAG TPA: hypothetical protein VK437_15375 [Steroidobacteraceae bacterium]|nr:hypothetical protein [Steroidobacteraceae bacterium]